MRSSGTFKDCGDTDIYITDHGWFKSFKLGYVTYYFDTAQELVNFKNQVHQAYEKYLKEAPNG